ncbi:MAG: hypothetical protein EHM70_20655 [Chloroflexota bacterium]|nr:MAG: hypothetical protein EHM70_20655 [Chloroflexota bacterium]
MALFSKDLGIDLGTICTRAVEGGRIVLEEPTVAAIVVEEQKMVAWGQEAQNMYGRVPESIEVIRPLLNGVIADYEITEYILQDILRKVGGPVRIFRPRVMITVLDGVTSVERRAVHEAALQAGSREVYLIQQPLAAALMRIFGHLLIDMHIRLRLPLVAIQLKPGNGPALAVGRQLAIDLVHPRTRPDMIEGGEDDVFGQELVQAVVVFSREEALVPAPT